MDRTVQNHKNKRSLSFLPVDGNGVSVSHGQPRSSVQHDTFTQTREEQWTQQGKTQDKETIGQERALGTSLALILPFTLLSVVTLTVI